MKLKEELIKLGVLTSAFDREIFIWAKGHKAIGIVACFVSYALWGGGLGGDEEFSCIIKQKIFDYIGVHFQQNTDCSIILDQNQYINTINLMPISPEQSRQCYHPLSKEETTLLRGALRKLNWVAGMTRSEISFHVC